MPNPATILMFGRDPQLLETRRMVLERAGYNVSTTMALFEIGRETLSGRLDLLILCYSLSMEECGRALALAHTRWPAVKSLVLKSGASGCATAEFLDQIFNVTEGPAKLVSDVGQLVRTDSLTHTQVS